MVTSRLLAAVSTALVMSLTGVALATNFRGVTEWHVRRSMAVAGVLRRVPPWRWLPDPSYDKRLARFVLLERLIGAAFFAAGLVLLAVAVHTMLTGQEIFSSR